MAAIRKNPPADSLLDKRLYVFDMDGTIYLGTIVFDFAIRFINHLRASGRKVLFFTNNASHSTSFYVEKLTRLGFNPTPDEIMTSGDVTVAFLKSRFAGKTVYMVATEQLCESFSRAGIRLINGHEDECTTADVVVSSFDTELTYHKVDAGCRFIHGGAAYLCTHPDFNCPTETGFMPDSGAIAAMMTASTGITPRFLGKPYAEVVEMIEEMTGISRQYICVFGDRLYTDIALGTRNGVTSVLVLTGETKESDIPTAPAEQQPTLVYDSLADVDQAMFAEK